MLWLNGGNRYPHPEAGGVSAAPGRPTTIPVWGDHKGKASNILQAVGKQCICPAPAGSSSAQGCRAKPPFLPLETQEHATCQPNTNHCHNVFPLSAPTRTCSRSSSASTCHQYCAPQTARSGADPPPPRRRIHPRGGQVCRQSWHPEGNSLPVPRSRACIPYLRPATVPPAACFRMRRRI